MTTQTAQDRLEDVARQAQNGVHAGQSYAHQAVDRLADSATDWTHQAAPVVHRLTERATDLANHGIDWMRDRSDRVRTEVARASDRTVGYVRDEPARSLLMAAAAGAVIFALVRWAGSRAHR